MKKILHAVAAASLLIGVTACEPTDSKGDRTNASKHGKSTKAKGGDSGSSSSGPDNSTKTQDGPVTWGNWEVVGPLQPKQDGLNQFALSMRVKNIGSSPDDGFFTVTILKGQNILTTMDCSTSTVQPKQIATSDCVSMDDFVPGWTEITVENAF